MIRCERATAGQDRDPDLDRGVLAVFLFQIMENDSVRACQKSEQISPFRLNLESQMKSGDCVFMVQLPQLRGFFLTQFEVSKPTKQYSK